jgi:hypothetical protein
MARVHDVVTLARQAARQIVEGRDQLLLLQNEIDANGGGAWLEGGIEGANADITAAQVASATYDTADAIDGLLTANGNAHAGNLYRIL